MNAFAVYWSGAFLDRLREEQDAGPLTVLFGGGSIPLPSLSSVREGDVLYPIHIRRGMLYVLARLTVDAFLSIEDYAGRVLGLDNPAEFYHTLYAVYPGRRPRPAGQPLHRFPQTGAVTAALGRGSTIRLRHVPPEALARLTFGPKAGRERPLPLRNGKVSSKGFSGSVRRLGPDSLAVFKALFAKEAEL